MSSKRLLSGVQSLLCVLFIGTLFGQGGNFWKADSILFHNGPAGSFDEVAVKDPSIVYFENAWHLFYTARSKDQYTTAYASAKQLKDLNHSQRFPLEQIRGKERYGCAPQIFYFSPHKKWYLIYQNRDENYQPAFSTNTDIAKPELWTTHENLLVKDEERKWIDFWIIAHDSQVYLFYTVAHGGVMLRSTSIQDFPHKWGESKLVFDDVHEAVHIYKVKDKEEFHMFYELNEKGIRSFGFAKSSSLDKNWEKVTDTYASGELLKFSYDSRKWTDMVSHGELIRSSYDEKMEYDPRNCRWLIQGILEKDMLDDYPSLPWNLGIIQKTSGDN